MTIAANQSFNQIRWSKMPSSNRSLVRNANPARRVLTSLIIGILGVSLTACAGLGLKTERQVSRERLATYLAANPDIDRATAAAMRDFKVRRGMTPQQVTAVWGKPHEIRKLRNGRVTHWLFPCGWPAHCFPGDTRGGKVEPQYTEAYFEKGRLVRWWSP